MISSVLEKYKKMPLPLKLTFWTFVCLILQKTINIITVPLFSRIMSTEEYGQYSVFLSWQTIFEIIISFRLYAGVYNKGLNKYKNDKDAYALTMQYLTTFMTLIVILLYIPVRAYINRLTGLNTCLTIAIFIECLFGLPLQFWGVKERYDYKYRDYVIVTVAFSICNALIGIVAVLMSEQKGIARIIATVVIQVVFGLYIYGLNIKNAKGKINFSYAKYAFLFNLPLIPHYLSEYILNTSDRIMIQKIVGYAEAGLYSVAYSMGMVLTIISSCINQALVPWLYHKLDEKEYLQINKNVSLIGAMLVIPLLVFSLLAPEVILIMGGKKYINAMYVIPPVCASVFFLFWYTLCANVEFYMNKNKFTMYISMIGAFANIISNYLLIPRFGYIIAGYTTLLSYIIYGLGHYLYMQRVFKKQYINRLFNTKIYILEAMVLLVGTLLANITYNLAIVRYTLIAMITIIIILLRKKIVGVFTSIKSRM